MPIRKYRSVEDMPPIPARPRLDPENLRIACELSELVLALHGRRLEPGVKKYRSLEEAYRGRLRVERRSARKV